MAEGFAQDSASAMTLEPPLSSVKEALTLRAIVCAVILGSAVCFANMYLGLQSGVLNAMSMQSALLGFAFFQNIQHDPSKLLSPAETTVIEVIAGAIGLAPFISGYTTFIPALEFLTTPTENGSNQFSIAQLLVWSIATCALGIVVAAPFRQLFILRERLRYPSATATGTLIGVLFGEETIIARAQQSETYVSKPQRLEVDIEFDIREAVSQTEANLSDVEPSDDIGISSDQASVGNAVKILLVSLTGSSLFSLVAYFIPILRNVPIFGRTVAKDWLWAFDLSPAYFGYGIIVGPSVNVCILLGAIVGWGILSPIAKHKGWATGPVDNWDTGSRGWILWVGMGLILGDSTVGLGWIIIKPLIPWVQCQAKKQHRKRSRSQESGERGHLLDDNLGTRCTTRVDYLAMDDDWATTSRVTISLILWTGATLLLLYFVLLLGIFRKFFSAIATVVAILLIPPAAFIAMRSLGETDNGAALAIGRLAQFILGLVVPASNPNYIFANLLLGGAVEAGASQASQQMGGLKTAYMTRTAPRAIYFGQMIGSFAGTLIATSVYKIYTSTKKIPSKEFEIPDAHIWLIAARLIYQQDLPPRVVGFAMGAFAIGAAFSVLRILGLKLWWRDWVPSSVAIAIGMYIVPAMTLPRAFGSLILVISRGRLGAKSLLLICSATGLILGQGLFSLVTLLFDMLNILHL